jgi:hypothetical protein
MRSAVKSSERDSATERELLETFIEVLHPRYVVELSSSTVRQQKYKEQRK